jgi:hypothetical protein
LGRTHFPRGRQLLTQVLNSSFEHVELSTKFTDLILELTGCGLVGFVLRYGSGLEVSCWQGFVNVSLIVSEEANASVVEESGVG